MHCRKRVEIFRQFRIERLQCRHSITILHKMTKGVAFSAGYAGKTQASLEWFPRHSRGATREFLLRSEPVHQMVLRPHDLKQSFLPDLTGAANDRLVGREFRQADGSASVEFLRADSDFGAHSEFEAVRKSSGGVDVDASRVHLIYEPLRVAVFLRDDGFRVRGSIFRDVLQRQVQHRQRLQEHGQRQLQHRNRYLQHCQRL